jgi:rfaE bifunctional protein kinase chain/domain
MVLRHMDEELGAGGGANLARNCYELGARTKLIGLVGKDSHGRELRRLLEAGGIDVSDVVALADRITPTKTRILGAEPGRSGQQVLRIDREPDEPPAPAVRLQIASRVRELAGEVDALLVSDYGYGLAGDDLADAVRQVANSGATVVLDPRHTLDGFEGITALTPNMNELAEATGRTPEALLEPREVLRAANEVLDRLRPRWLLVTMGNRGMLLISEELRDGVHVGPSGADSVVDVSGAGDTAAATFTLALATGIDGPRAMRLANAAAGVVVMEQGTAICELSKLRSALPGAPRPVLPADTIQPVPTGNG